VYSLDIVGMIVSPRPSHSFRIDVIGHDVVVAGKFHLTDRTLPALFDNFLRLSNFRISAFERSSRYPLE
jgi:hypothetical protein